MQTLLSTNIRKLRKAHGLTQAQLAAKLHKAGSTVRMWELDKASPDAETLVMLARVFSVSTDYLLTDTTEPVESATPEQQPESKQIAKINKDLARLSQRQLKLVGELVREMSTHDRQRLSDSHSPTDSQQP